MLQATTRVQTTQMLVLTTKRCTVRRLMFVNCARTVLEGWKSVHVRKARYTPCFYCTGQLSDQHLTSICMHESNNFRNHRRGKGIQAAQQPLQGAGGGRFMAHQLGLRKRHLFYQRFADTHENTTSAFTTSAIRAYGHAQLRSGGSRAMVICNSVPREGRSS